MIIGNSKYILSSSFLRYSCVFIDFWRFCNVHINTHTHTLAIGQYFSFHSIWINFLIGTANPVNFYLRLNVLCPQFSSAISSAVTLDIFAVLNGVELECKWQSRSSDDLHPLCVWNSFTLRTDKVRKSFCPNGDNFFFGAFRVISLTYRSSNSRSLTEYI